MRVHLALALALCAGTASAQTMMPIPPYSSTYSYNYTRGFYFQAPVSIIITGLRVPDEQQNGLQNVEVFIMQQAPPPYSQTASGGQVFYATGVPSSQIISTSILVNAGDWVGVLGACGPDPSTGYLHNSYGAGPFTSDIMGTPVTLTRFITQFNIATGGNNPYSSSTGSLGRVEVYYNPPTGLYSNFSATPTSGASPLAVQFTDTTYTSDPGGVTSWAWDFENDGTVDSTVQNPSFTYTSCGYYDVSLTTTDATHPPSTEVKTAFITVDPQLLVTADFTATPTVVSTPGGVVNFTDTSSGSPTAWAWDLDGDGTTDSTVQNPTFTYNTVGLYDVTLTASNACGGNTVTKTAFINAVGSTSNSLSAEILEYQFNEVRGDKVFNCASTTLAPAFGTVVGSAWQGDPGRAGFMGNEAGFGCMAADNTSPYESKVDSGWTIDITGSHTIMFWHRPHGTPGTSYAFGGSSGSARCYNYSHFSLRTWGNLSGYVDSATDPDLLTGWNHWAMVLDDAAGTGQWYLNGVPDGSPLSFTPGTFAMSGFGTFLIGGYGTTSSMFSRYHDMDDFRLYGRALTPAEVQAAMLHENATTGRYDEGCAGPSTIPAIGANGVPTPGNASFAFTLDDAEAGRGCMLVLGFEANNWMGAVPLPYSLDFFFGSGSGCNLQTGIDIAASHNTGTGSTSYPAPVPFGAAGAHMYAQWIVLGSQGAVSSGLDINVELP